MPSLHEDFVRYASLTEQSVPQMVQSLLYSRGQHQVPLTVGKKTESFTFMPGHLWGFSKDTGQAGPTEAEVMVVGQTPTPRELSVAQLFSDQAGIALSTYLRAAGCKKQASIYVTNVLKTRKLTVDNASFKQAWIKQQSHFLFQELHLVRPKYVIALGVQACKALFGSQAKLSDYEGQVRKVSVPDPYDKNKRFEFVVVAAMHPAAIMMNNTHSTKQKFSSQMALAARVIAGKHEEEVNLNHVIVDNADDLRRWCQVARKEAVHRFIALDAEWEGQSPHADGAYMRCVQFSWKPHHAVVVALTHPGGEPRFTHKVVTSHEGQRQDTLTTDNGTQVALQIMQDMFRPYSDGRRPRPVGHNMMADFEWLEHYGMDIREAWECTDRPSDCRDTGGFDTIYAAHAWDETADLDLTSQITMHTDAEVYDGKLKQWLSSYCKVNKIKIKSLAGYGVVPDEILYPYAALDADVTIRLALFYRRALNRDTNNQICWRHYWSMHCASLPTLEMRQTGMKLDKDRCDAIALSYVRKRDELLDRFRRRIRWPDFNVNSSFQLRELLFGTRYNNKIGPDGKPRRLRPPQAISLNAKPIKTTDKYSQSWDQVIADDAEDEKSAAADKLSIGILKLRSKELEVRRFDHSKKEWTWQHRDCSGLISDLQDLKYISQLLKNPLCAPSYDPVKDEWQYSKGLPSFATSDGMIRTYLSILKETGRWSSSRPPLQNLSSARDADLKRIMAENWVAGIRSILAAPDDMYLVSADYSAAEVLVAAIQSGDEMLLKHSLDPDHDMHSHIAVSAFKLDCPPTKKGLEDIGQEKLRIGAKTTIFGYFYGQSIESTMLNVMYFGVNTSYDEISALRNTFESTYPGIPPFFEQAKQRPFEENQKWGINALGGMRRLPLTTKYQELKSQGRELANFFIQGVVAQVVNRAVRQLQKERDKRRMSFKLAMQVHDSVMFFVHASEIAELCNEVIPLCMSKRVPIYRTSFDGVRHPDAVPHHFHVDVDVYKRWGEYVPSEELEKLGVN